MDREDLRSVLRTTGVDLWTLIDTAIAVAVADHGAEVKLRRDGIVERLFTPPPPPPPPDRCRNCGSDEGPIVVFGEEKEREEAKGSSSPIAKPAAGSPTPPTPQSNHRDEPEEDEEEEEGDNRRSYGRSIASEKKKVLAIKEFLEDPDQSEDSVANLLQNLADMDITFKTLKETDIGRHVNGLRKHPSNEVRRLVKQLVRKWKEIVDEWVKNSASDTASPAIITDGDSPQQITAKSNHNGHQVPDFAYSPNPHNGHLGSDRNTSLEPVETKAKAVVVQRREAPPKPTHSTPSSATPAKVKEQQKDSMLDPERLASARKRLQENYQEAQNAKKQRTIQVMDIHEIPRPKNSFVARNKGGFQAKHW